MLSFSLLKFNNAKRFLQCQPLEIIKIHSSWILNADTPAVLLAKGGSQLWRGELGDFCTSLATIVFLPERKEPSTMLGVADTKVPRVTIITICNKRRRETGSGGKAFKSVKFMRAMEAQIEIISLCADK